MTTSRGHEPVIDWPGGIGILLILGALAMAVARCQPLVPPPPDPGPPIEPTQPDSCSRACENLRRLACPWAAPTPGEDGQLGTADDGTCEQVCSVAEADENTTLNASCVAKATSCDGAESCTR